MKDYTELEGQYMEGLGKLGILMFDLALEKGYSEYDFITCIEMMRVYAREVRGIKISLERVPNRSGRETVKGVEGFLKGN